MITAKLTSRTYVPYLTIAIKFADIKFMGNRETKEILDDLMHEIEFKKYDIKSGIISWYDNFKEFNNEKIKELNSKVVELKNAHKLPVVFYKNAYKQIKELKKQIEVLQQENTVFDYRVKELEDDRFFSASDLKYKFEDALSDLEFNYKNSDTAGKERLTDITIYEFNGDETQLIKKAKEMMKEIEKSVNASVRYEKTQEKTYCKTKGINIEEKVKEIKQQELTEEYAHKKILANTKLFSKYLSMKIEGKIKTHAEFLQKYNEEIEKK